MKEKITNRTLRDIKKLAKEKRKENPNGISFCQMLDVATRELTEFPSYHDVQSQCKKAIPITEQQKFDPLEGLTPEQRQEYYHRMIPILDRDIFQIYPDSYQYISEEYFDFDDF